MVQQDRHPTACRTAATDALRRFMSDEDVSTSFTYAGFCQAALPHRKLKDDEVWEVRSENVSLIVEPGARPSTDGSKAVRIGVPYGSRARLILFYLQTEATKTRSRDIELGSSLHEWIGRMGIVQGGKSTQLIKDQAERISRCRLTFNIRRGETVGLVNRQIIDRAILAPIDSQGDLFTQRARLSEDFYNEMLLHSVPLQETAIKCIANNSAALDLYAWLAYRLHVLERPLALSWASLHAQFGLGISKRWHFRKEFKTNLDLAMAVYPEARVEVSPENVVLWPSKPPVTPMSRPAEAKRICRPDAPARRATVARASTQATVGQAMMPFEGNGEA